MNKPIRIVLPLLVVAVAVLGGRAILSSSPEAERREPRVSLPAIEAIRLVASDYAVQILSQGTVRPSTEAALVPEVVGAVTGLHPEFVIGGSFRKGDVLVQLDERDYTIALTRALAGLAQADAALAEQEALASMARADWEALGRRGDASALMLREPQAAAASADLEAARAEVEKAKLDLTRTRIVAPWDGQVLTRDVDVGQFVNRGTPIGRIHATDSVDVRLPVSARQLEFLDLSMAGVASATAPQVTLGTTTGSVSRRWSGRLVRAEGFDAATQQLNVIARVSQPYADPADPLRIGRFVSATIDGRTLADVFVIPRGSLREGREVLVLDESDSSVRRRPVVVAWSDEDVVVVREGLVDGEVLVLTPLVAIVDGAPVSATIDGEAPPLGEERKRPREGGPQDDLTAEGA